MCSIAQKLREDVKAADIEYQRVAPMVLKLTTHGRPLATASNSAVWEALLEERPHCPSLKQLIRFYLSIEDGECQVERDLGVLSKENKANLNGHNQLGDDLMLLQTDPIGEDDIWMKGKSAALGQGSSCSRLGIKGRRWAELWRQIYGARLGIYRTRKATGSIAKDDKRPAKRPGTYSAAKCGVLAAAEYTVELSKQSQDVSDQRTPLGVSKSFLQSAVGDKNASPYNNAKLRKFQALTVKKKNALSAIREENCGIAAGAERG